MPPPEPPGFPCFLPAGRSEIPWLWITSAGRRRIGHGVRMAFDDIEGYGLRRALGAGSVGSVWLARDLSSGRPVAIERLERRGPLRTGELVTLLGPVAEALAAAHRTGLTHGHLGGGDILLTADGRPMLADC